MPSPPTKLLALVQLLPDGSFSVIKSSFDAAVILAAEKTLLEAAESGVQMPAWICDCDVWRVREVKRDG